MGIYGEDISLDPNGLGPGIRLLPQRSEHDSDGTLASAVPVFISWRWGAELSPEILHLASAADIPVLWPAGLRDPVVHYFDNGGGPCWVYVGSSPETSNYLSIKTWWDSFLRNASTALLGEASLTLVAVPQLVQLVENIENITGDDIVGELIDSWKTLLSTFSSRRDLFFVLDAPTQPAVATACIQAWRNGAAQTALGQRAALYGPHLVTDYPWVNSADTVVEDGFLVLPPSGAVLGVYARTDASSGVWKAPANEALAHVVRPQFRETLTHDWFRDNQASINLIRSFAGRGTRISHSPVSKRR